MYLWCRINCTTTGQYYHRATWSKKINGTIPRYRLPPIEIDPVETQIWEVDGAGKGPDLAIVGGFELSKTLNNSFVEFCRKVAPSYLITPSKEGAHHWWDDELPWKLLVMVWLSLDFDASHVLFWFKWLMCLRKETSWISGVSQFVKWMSWFCLGGNISYYIIRCCRYRFCSPGFGRFLFVSNAFKTTFHDYEILWVIHPTMFQLPTSCFPAGNGSRVCWYPSGLWKTQYGTSGIP